MVARSWPIKEITVTKEDLTTWALSTGWKLIDGHPSLSKPSRPNDAIVRLMLKATVVNVEIRKPAGILSTPVEN